MRHPVGRYFENEVAAAAFEVRETEQFGAEKHHEDAGEVDAKHHKRPIAGEKQTDEHDVNRQPRTARDERNGEDRENPFLLVGNRSRRHDRRHGAAETGDDRHDRLAVEPETGQELVHDDRDAGHVASAFEYGKQEEQNHDLRQEHQHPADAGEHAVDDQTLGEPGDADDVQCPSAVDHDVFTPQEIESIGQIGTDAEHPAETDLVDGEHDREKNRNAPRLMGQDAVDFLVEVFRMFLVFDLDQTVVDDRLNELPAGVEDRALERQRNLLVENALFDFADDLSDLFLLDDIEELEDAFVAFQDLQGEPLFLDLQVVVTKQVMNPLDAPFDGLRIVEFNRLEGPQVLQFLGDLVLILGIVVARRDGNRVGLEMVAQLGGVDDVAVVLEGVFEIEHEQGRNAEFEQLDGEMEVAFEMRRIDDVDDAVVRFVEKRVGDDAFVFAGGRHVVGAGQVDEFGVFHVLDVMNALFHGDATVVADVDVGLGHRVEERRFARVGITGQQINHGWTSICAASSRRMQISTSSTSSRNSRPIARMLSRVTVAPSYSPMSIKRSTKVLSSPFNEITRAVSVLFMSAMVIKSLLLAL